MGRTWCNDLGHLLDRMMLVETNVVDRPCDQVICINE